MKSSIRLHELLNGFIITLKNILLPVLPTLLAPRTTSLTVLLGAQSRIGYSGMGTSRKLLDPPLMVPGCSRRRIEKSCRVKSFRAIPAPVQLLLSLFPHKRVGYVSLMVCLNEESSRWLCPLITISQ